MSTGAGMDLQLRRPTQVFAESRSKAVRVPTGSAVIWSDPASTFVAAPMLQYSAGRARARRDRDRHRNARRGVLRRATSSRACAILAAHSGSLPRGRLRRSRLIRGRERACRSEHRLHDHLDLVREAPKLRSQPCFPFLRCRHHANDTSPAHSCGQAAVSSLNPRGGARDVWTTRAPSAGGFGLRAGGAFVPRHQSQWIVTDSFLFGLYR